MPRSKASDGTDRSDTTHRTHGPAELHSDFRWSALLWALLAPRPRQRTTPTIAGVLLIGLALGVGTAAYNAANNILFITLSLLLACLILSGVLAGLNFRRVSWQVRLAPAWRAGHDATIGLALANAKRLLPTHALWFDLTVRRAETGAPARAESTLTGRGIDVREALAKADAVEARTRLFLDGRLAPGGERRLEWTLRPERRGRMRVAVAQVGSLFPFGFLQKSFATDEVAEVLVWPESIAYRRQPATAARRAAGEERLAQVGAGSDLLGLRRYEAGDSHRLIHWKASARTGRLLVRQFAAESTERLALRLATDAALWPEPEGFERAVRLAATLAEDLFRANRLVGVALDAEPARPVRRVRDLEAWLDRLAVVERRPEPAAGARGGRGDADTITFAPDGPQQVAAKLHGTPIARA